MTSLSEDERRFALIVKWLLEASRGGAARALILLALKNSPLNPHQLSRRLGFNYRTITHHLEVLEKNGLVEKVGAGYGAPYTLSREALLYWGIIESSIKRVLGS